MVLLLKRSRNYSKVIDGVVQAIAPTTAEQKLAKKNELKARGTLLMALPDKHQLKFNTHKDAKSLMEAIEKRGDSSQVEDGHAHHETMRFFQRTGRNLGANGTTSIGFDMSKVECYHFHRRGYFIRKCMSPRDTRNKDTQRRIVPLETYTSNALVSQCSDSEVAPCSKSCTKADATLQSHYDKLTIDFRKSPFDVLSYKTSLESVKARLVVYQQNENVFKEDIKLLKLDVMLRDNALVKLRKKFKKAKKRDESKLTLENFQTSSKNLSKLLESQITNKTCLGYDTYVFNSIVFDSNELISSDSNESVPTSPMHDRYKSCDGYHAVFPPYTRTFMPFKHDLVFHDALTVSKTVLNVFNVEPSTIKPPKELSQSNRPSAPITED
nr:hypothetical protein [Tanacetum cinerariifolium]